VCRRFWLGVLGCTTVALPVSQLDGGLWAQLFGLMKTLPRGVVKVMPQELLSVLTRRTARIHRVVDVYEKSIVK
jgi:hypothetical protein